MEGQANPLRRFNFKTGVSVLLAYGLANLALSNAQFTACTTRGNHTEDIYREVPIKNERTSVTLSSPNFPKPYPQNIQCTWRIVAPIGYQVKLSFLEFDLEDSYLESGCHDYVSVRDGGLVFSEANEISKQCGKSNPPTVSSSNAVNVLWIRFLTDKEVEEKGFSIKVLPVRGSISKQYIAIGVLVSLLLIIIIAIILCRKRFKRNDMEAPKVRQYQELPVPTDVEPEQRDPSLRGPEIPEEDLWSSERKTTEQERGSGNFYVPPLKNSEASGYCFLLEEGDGFEFKSNRPFNKATPKKPMTNEQEELEYTELLTVV